MTIKDLKQLIDKYDESKMLLIGDWLTDRMGWDNVELIEYEGELYFMPCGEVECEALQHLIVSK